MFICLILWSHEITRVLYLYDNDYNILYQMMWKKFLKLYMYGLFLTIWKSFKTYEGILSPNWRISTHFKMVYYKNYACSDTVLIYNAAGSQHDCSWSRWALCGTLCDKKTSSFTRGRPIQFWWRLIKTLQEITGSQPVRSVGTTLSLLRAWPF